MSLDETRQLLLESAKLRAQYRFTDAIVLVEERLSEIHAYLQENALLEIIYAAQEAGDREKAVAYARKLARLDPDIPTVRRLLAGAGSEN